MMAHFKDLRKLEREFVCQFLHFKVATSEEHRHRLLFYMLDILEVGTGTTYHLL